MRSRWVITGLPRAARHALSRRCSAREAGRRLAAAGDLPELDIADARRRVASFLTRLWRRRSSSSNAAAFTHVDRCEREPGGRAARERRRARRCLARTAAPSAASRLVHVSTDYVFAGVAERRYREDDPPARASEYGRSKLEGERRVLAGCASALRGAHELGLRTRAQLHRRNPGAGRGAAPTAGSATPLQRRRRPARRGPPTPPTSRPGSMPWSKPERRGAVPCREPRRGDRGGSWRARQPRRSGLRRPRRSTASAPRT